jgi:hypothetical protein
MSENMNTHIEGNYLLGAETLIAVAIVFLYSISGSIFEKMKFQYIHESGLSMIIGLIITLIATYINPKVRNIQN